MRHALVQHTPKVRLDYHTHSSSITGGDIIFVHSFVGLVSRQKYRWYTWAAMQWSRMGNAMLVTMRLDERHSILNLIKGESIQWPSSRISMPASCCTIPLYMSAEVGELISLHTINMAE